MGVELTYLNLDNNQVTEIVDVIQPSDELHVEGFVVDSPKIQCSIRNSGYILFEDEYGLFGLTENQIVNIEPLNEELN
jgi:hypothetical protein